MREREFGHRKAARSKRRDSGKGRCVEFEKVRARHMSGDANVSKASDTIQKSQADAQALKDKIAGVQTTLKQFLSEAPK